jgi:hypothetical protein
MIIIKVFQGLGNQMFQYSLGRALERRFSIKVKYDLSWFKENSNHRNFGLNKFNLVIEEPTDEEIYNIKNGIFKNRLINFFFQRRLNFLPYFKKPFFKEDLKKLDVNILKINSRTYIEGYFTSEFFFKDIRSVLINDFQLASPPSPENKALIEMILNQNSVCLSVRRGDFLKYSIHNVCDLNYFNDSIDLIKKKVNDPVFYIFSDDNEWVQKNLKIEGEHHFIAHNFPDFYEDFRIMKSCKHHIIPNSTFSWWAAWLANSNDKIVISPETWLNSEEIDYSYFLPADWIKVANFVKKSELS